MSKVWGAHNGYAWLKKDPLRKLLTLEEQGCYFAMFSQAIAAKHEGRIEVAPGRPYNRTKVARHLEVPLKVFISTLDKCIAYGRIALNGDVPCYVNWTATSKKVKPVLTPEQETINRRARLNRDVPEEYEYAADLVEQARETNREADDEG